MATNPQEVARHYYSLDEYFALEEASDARFEYWDGDIVCMSGGTRAHGRISSNIHVALALGVRGTSCEAFTGDTAIWTPAIPPYRYPDASVGCGELEFKRVRSLDALVNPVLIVEVLSPSTEAADKDAKFTTYQTIPSFREYVLISQEGLRLIHYVREQKGSWIRREVTGLQSSITLETINVTLPMQDIYARVTFSSGS